MKIEILEKLNGTDVMRRSGYGLINDHRTGLTSFVRTLGSGFYPRYHAYLDPKLIKLHLDQKQASYEGSNAHSGEYEGEAVEREGERIKAVMEKMLADLSPAVEEVKKPKSKGLWSWFLGD